MPDFGVSGKNFGGVFQQLSTEYGVRSYSFDRRGFGASQGRRGDLMIDDRSFRDHWDFFDSCSFLRGYPQALPKILVSHGLGSLYAALLCSQRPGFFKASVSISPWLGMANTPSQFQLALLRAKALTSKASSLYQPIGPYLAS